MAPRRLDGWEPRAVSIPEYDGDRIVRTVEYWEPEWDDDQRDLMLAYKQFADDIGPHGFLMSEATDPGADPTEYDNPLRFGVEAPIVDWVRKAQLDAEAAWRTAEGDDANMNGLIFPVRKYGG